MRQRRFPCLGAAYARFSDRLIDAGAQPSDVELLTLRLRQEVQVEGLLRHGDQLWSPMQLQPGEHVLELGPGRGLFALGCALRGTHVTLIEHPACPFLPELQRMLLLMEDALASVNGSITLWIGDPLNPGDAARLCASMSGQRFDHLVAHDVFCPAGQDRRTFVQSRALPREWDLASCAAYLGVYEPGDVTQLLRWLISFKRPGTGTISINHIYSLSRSFADVQAQRFRPRGLRELHQLPQLLVEAGLSVTSRGLMATPRHPLPAARLYRFGDQNL